MTLATQDLQVEALGLAEEVATLQVIDQPSFDRAGLMLRTVKDYLKRVGEVLDPIIRAAHEAHKLAVEQKRKLDAPALSAELTLKRALAGHEERERQRVREAEQQADAIRRQLEEEAKLKAALEAEARGDDKGAEQILEAPTPPAPIIVPTVVGPALPKTEGVSFKTTYRAEVVDLRALVDAIAGGKASVAYVLPNLPALNQAARALKEELRIPGVRVIPERVTAVRT
jgi:hypothetical protein